MIRNVTFSNAISVKTGTRGLQMINSAGCHMATSQSSLDVRRSLLIISRDSMWKLQNIVLEIISLLI